jgi:hypothetical protein
MRNQNTITTSERIGHWAKTRRFLARFSGREASVHSRYLVDFTITTSGCFGFRYTHQAMAKRLSMDDMADCDYSRK